MSTLWGLLIAVAIVGLISGLVIWIVGKLRLGLEVDGFGSAFIAAFVIATVAGMITLAVSFAGMMDDGGLVGGIIHLIVSVIMLMIGGRLLPGVKVTSSVGALVASIAIGAVYWLGGLLLGLLI